MYYYYINGTFLHHSNSILSLNEMIQVPFKTGYRKISVTYNRTVVKNCWKPTSLQIRWSLGEIRSKVFSFWTTTGPCNEAHPYLLGRHIRICLSNYIYTLYMYMPYTCQTNFQVVKQCIIASVFTHIRIINCKTTVVNELQNLAVIDRPFKYVTWICDLLKAFVLTPGPKLV